MVEQYKPEPIARHQDVLVQASADEILFALAKFFKVESHLDDDDAMIGLFIDAYGRTDIGSGESYRKRVATRDYQLYKGNGEFPGYVLTAYKEAVKYFADNVAKAAEIKTGLGIVTSDTNREKGPKAE